MKDAVTVDSARTIRAWRGTLLLSAGAMITFLVMRWLPLADGSLHYSDFGEGQRGFLEFCEPGSPQFAPVDRVRSPVTLELIPAGPLRAGEAAPIDVRLTTASGKAISAEDLVEVHTRKLHLLLIDASLDDYQHVHPDAGEDASTFSFEFTPRRAGTYRIFADFMPRATGRGLYAGAVLEVATATPAARKDSASFAERATVTVDDVRFRLETDQQPLRINQSATLVLTIARENGGALELEDVMGAPAHLVAFDERCSGFAHLHPLPPSPDIAGWTDAGRRLAFTIHLPDPGWYRLWAQVKVDGREIFAPFDVRVEP